MRVRGEPDAMIEDGVLRSGPENPCYFFAARSRSFICDFAESILNAHAQAPSRGGKCTGKSVFLEIQKFDNFAIVPFAFLYFLDGVSHQI